MFWVFFFMLYVCHFIIKLYATAWHNFEHLYELIVHLETLVFVKYVPINTNQNAIFLIKKTTFYIKYY